MIDASHALESDAEPEWRRACAQQERDAEAAKARKEAWRNEVRHAAIGGAELPSPPADAEEPPPPARPRLVAMDCSTEELQRLLADAPRGLLYVRDELAGWLGGFDRYSGCGADRAFFLECWNGGAYVCDRVRYHGAPIRIEHATLAIVGGMVPDRLRKTLKDADDGLVARLILVWPAPVPITSLADRGAADALRRGDMLMGAARRLRGLPMGADRHGTPAPIALPLDGDARSLFDELRRHWMARAREASGLVAGWAGKNPGRALRLALVSELLAFVARGDAEPASVSADAMARAGAFLDYAASMLDRVTAGLAVGEAEVDATVIGRHLLATRPTGLNERALYQSPGFAWAREEKRRRAALPIGQEKTLRSASVSRYRAGVAVADVMRRVGIASHRIPARRKCNPSFSIIKMALDNAHLTRQLMGPPRRTT
jgi:hypothetical protein